LRGRQPRNKEGVQMRLYGKNSEGLENTTAEALETEMMESIMADHRSYHELEDMPVLEVDVLTQFRTNMQVLADLTSRLTFMTREIRYVMKVD
jgi:hypothetical protein